MTEIKIREGTKNLFKIINREMPGDKIIKQENGFFIVSKVTKKKEKK